jgi:hypothetical protein
MAGSFENGSGSSGSMENGNFLVILLTTGLSSRILPHEVRTMGLNLVISSSVTLYRTEFECVNKLSAFQIESLSAQGVSVSKIYDLDFLEVYEVLQNRLLWRNTLIQCTFPCSIERHYSLKLI